MHSWGRAHLKCQLNLDIPVVQLSLKMTLENFLSQIGMGTKPLIDRHSEYGGPMQDQHVYYAYESSAPSHGSGATSKHHYGGGGGHKSGAAMSALTLLAFLFFLHILQQCIKDHMAEMTAAPVMIMSAGREGETMIAKSVETQKIDKNGVVSDTKVTDDNDKIITKNQYQKIAHEESLNKYDGSNRNEFTRIDETTHSTKGSEKYKYIYKNYGNRTSTLDGFVSAMEDN